jgi:polar amino acid transport system substrate-binding protein
VAYAVADHLGFAKEEVRWVALAYTSSFKPGPKDYDFYLAQVSIKPKRAQNADFSPGYYQVNQALIALKGSPITQVTSLADLKDYKLGAPLGSTSYDYIVDTIQPTKDPGVYDSLNDVNSALQAGQIDGEVVDYPTAFFITGSGEVKNSVVVGQFPTVGQPEEFGLVLQKDSPLTACVDQAVTSLKDDGTMQSLEDQWLSKAAGAPVLS